MCAEHDRLWAEYDAALRTYVAAVNSVPTPPANAAVVEAGARAMAHDARMQFREHCLSCGCDPDWLKADAKRLQVG